MTRLRKMMLEELQRRNYSTVTTRNYLRVVTEFANYFGKPPDRLGLNELRTYQAYLLRKRKLTPGSVVNQDGGTAVLLRPSKLLVPISRKNSKKQLSKQEWQSPLLD